MPEDENNVVPDLDPRLAALPRERMPSRLLEERTVKALRTRGLLRHRRPGAAWMAAAAAAVALFAGGFALGQWTGSRTMSDSMLAIRQQSAEDAAALVQRTGSAYVLALASLASHADAAPVAHTQRRLRPNGQRQPSLSVRTLQRKIKEYDLASSEDSG